MGIKKVELIKDIFEINRRICSSLWDIANVNSISRGLSPRLIVPQKRNGDIRISEQEARVLCCGILNTLNYYYSIETPTVEVCQQTGSKPVSASSDLSLYREKNDQFDKIMNVEFKAHNPAQEHIRKDIEKLVRESIPGNWFHLLKNVDSKTIPVLFGKMKESLFQCESFLYKTELSIIFCFCVLEKSWACIKHFYYNPAEKKFPEYIDTFFKLEYSIRKGEIVMDFKNNWNILRKLY